MSYPVVYAVPLPAVPPQRSVGVALLLTACFGTLGAFYAGGSFGTKWFLWSLLAIVLTLGAAALIVWPLVIIFTAVKVSNDNALRAQMLGGQQ